MSTPLQVPDKNLYVLLGDQRHGPFTLAQLREQFTAGKIGRATYLWYPGLLNWITVGDVPEFDRREIPVTPAQPEPSKGDEIWVYDRGNVLSLPADEVRQRIRDNRFRRADLVFDETQNKWLRADQFVDFARLFRPAVPPPPAPQDLEGEATVGGATSATIPATATPKPAPVPGPARIGAPPALGGKAEGAEVAAPAKRLSARRRLQWIFPGVAVAAVLLVLVFATGFWDVPGLVGVARSPAAPQASRAPASLAPSTSSLNLFFPLGISEADLQKTSAFSSCRRILESPTRSTYRCQGMHHALSALDVYVVKDRVDHLVGYVGTDSRQAAEYQRELLISFGQGERHDKSCDDLNEDQKRRFGSHCRARLTVETTWRDGGVEVRLLSSKQRPSEVPLELSFYPLTAK